MDARFPILVLCGAIMIMGSLGVLAGIGSITVAEEVHLLATYTGRGVYLIVLGTMVRPPATPLQ